MTKTQIEHKLDLLDDQIKQILEKQEPQNIWRDIWIPLLSTIIALTGVLSGIWIQNNTIGAQAEMNRYQVTFAAKQKGYAEFMSALQISLNNSLESDKETLIGSDDLIVSKYYAIEPFLSKSTLWDDMQEFISQCYDMYDSRDLRISDNAAWNIKLNSLLDLRNKIDNELREELFYSK